MSINEKSYSRVKVLAVNLSNSYYGHGNGHGFTKTTDMAFVLLRTWTCKTTDMETALLRTVLVSN